MRKEVRIAGFGGQGIVLAGVILGEAASREGMNVVQTQSYGPESRGGAARSEVVIADGLVDYPKVTVPDIFIALSQPGFDKYSSDVKKRTKIVVDKDLVKTDMKGAVEVPFLKTAEKVGRKIVANIVMLGYITSEYQIVSKKTMKATILDRIPKGTEKLNIKAFEEGYKMGGKS